MVPLILFLDGLGKLRREVVHGRRIGFDIGYIALLVCFYQQQIPDGRILFKFFVDGIVYNLSHHGSHLHLGDGRKVRLDDPLGKDRTVDGHQQQKHQAEKPFPVMYDIFFRLPSHKKNPHVLKNMLHEGNLLHFARNYFMQ